MARIGVLLGFVLGNTPGGAPGVGTQKYTQKASATRTGTLPGQPVVASARAPDARARLSKEDGGTSQDITSKVVLTNGQVLAAGTKTERDTDKNKPMPVTVVTLLVDPEEAERLTLASTEGKIQLALRNPLDKATPSTHGIRPAALLGFAAPAQRAAVRTRLASGSVAPSSGPIVSSAPDMPTV